MYELTTAAKGEIKESNLLEMRRQTKEEGKSVYISPNSTIKEAKNVNNY